MPKPLRISAVDGYALGATEFSSSGAPRAVVVIAGATGVHQRYYARFAQWLCAQGAVVFTFDYRGIGESKPHRLAGFSAQMRDWGQLDLEGVLRFAQQHWPGLPLHFIGHSVGGQLLGFAPSNGAVTRAVTVCSQSGYWKLWPLAARLPMAAIWYGVFPLATAVAGKFPGKLGVGEDLPEGVASEWARWGRSARFFLSDGISVDGFERVRGELLSFSFSDDWYAPRAAVEWLHGLYSRATVFRRHFSPKTHGKVGHFGFFRSAQQDTLWPLVSRFFDAEQITPAVLSTPSAEVLTRA